jgi:hypothetical protein
LREQYDNDSSAQDPRQRGRAGLVCARRMLAGVLVLAAVTQGSLWAQTIATKSAPAPDRFLLIVETSKPMQRRADAVLGIVQDILMSGLNDQFRNGCTVGVWTFNADLSTRGLPLQTWSSSERENITQRTLTFLKGQKYEKQANFDKVAPALAGVIGDSRRLTVIVISSGDWKIQGTPFDDKINGSFQQWRDQQRKARMPFVTFLCARKGRIGAFAVNTPPWPLQVPQLAEEPKSIQTTNRQPPQARHIVQTSTVAPLIISGKKPRLEPVPAPKPEPAVTQTAAPPPVAAAAVTNQPTAVKPPEPVAPPAEVAKAQPAPVVPEKLVSESLPKPAPTLASEPKPEPVKVPQPKSAEPAPAKPEPAPTPAVLMPKPEPLAAEQPKHATAPEVKPEPAPAPIAIAEPPTAAATSAAATQVTTTNPSSLAVPPSSRPAAPEQAATVAPAESLLRTRNILIAAVLLAVVAVGLALLLTRRSRTAPQGSLITRSFEREKGP